MKFKKNITIISLIAFSLAPLGQSAWVTFYDTKIKSYSKNITTDITKVAYTINDSKVITYYLTIESALKHTTSGTVYVIPGTNPTITRDCEIKSGVTLCIPYDDNGDGTHSDYTNLKNQSNDGFADKDAAAVAKNRKNLITIASGITLTNNGTLDVAGKVGVGNSYQRPTGFTLGDYCEILMESNAKIQNKGSINLYGYIKESSRDNGSSVVNSSTGNIRMPFSIYDYRGGSYSSVAIDASIGAMPFSYFDFPNCHVAQVFEYGSRLTGYALLYASYTYNSEDALILGTSSDTCLFKMSQDTKVTIKYSPFDCGYTTADVSNNITTDKANYTFVTIDGDLELSYMKISSVDTSQIDCSICYKYQIKQINGTLTINNRMKFLSGSSLTIDNGAKCIMNAPVTFYQNYFPIATIGSTDSSPQKMGRSKLIVNGELILNSNFGGIINTENSSGVVSTGTDFQNFYVSGELIANNSVYVSNYEKHIESAMAYLPNGTDSILSKLDESGKEYHLDGNYWTDSLVDSKITQMTVNFAPAYGKSAEKKEASYTVKATCDYFTNNNIDATYTWSIDNNLSLTENINQVSFTTPAASSNDITYNLTCVITFSSNEFGNQSLTFKGKYVADSGGCVLPTALVLMSDGTYKQAGLLKIGDEVMCFNHETGKIISNKVIINSHIDEEANLYEVVHLEFENNRKTSLVDEHAYFDIEENKYVYLNKNNARDYIGHRFVFIDSKLNRFDLKLEKVTIEKMLTKLAAPVSAYHLNVIVDDMLSIEGAISGLFNVFEYDSKTLAFDKEKMQRDIDKYGLTDYETFKKYFPYEIFEKLLPCKYFDVALGKGLLTWDIIKSYIARWKNQLMWNLK